MASAGSSVQSRNASTLRAAATTSAAPAPAPTAGACPAAGTAARMSFVGGGGEDQRDGGAEDRLRRCDESEQQR